MASSSSSSRNWLYDVFLSFRGEDVRVNFRSHFLKELDRKLITAFKDNEIERSHSLWPELVQAIKESRIAVVVFSKNYASSSWCLNELLEIVNCKDNIVIPLFYNVDPSHVRHQIGEFGSIFEKTCEKHTEETKNQWKKALTDVANMLGFHSATWDNEAKMVEEIVNDVLCKLLSTTCEDSEDLVGIGDHIAEMSLLLQLESEDVRMVGIWGSSGIGKTTIARALFNRISHRFHGRSIFIDRAFVSKSMENYPRANPDDYNMKLHLQENFLSAILGKKDIKIDHLGAMAERLKYKKVLIVIDDLDDHVVLAALAGKTQWFGSGSRIIVATNDKHLLMAHSIDRIYEVRLPSEDHALQMFCQYAFRKNSPPQGYEKMVDVLVAKHAGYLPLGLNILGSYLRGRDKEYWMDMLPRLQNGLDGKIEKTMRFSYDGLDSAEDKAIFRHIACLFNHMEVTTIKWLLADSKFGINIGLKHLVDKSLIHVVRNMGRNIVEMHNLLQEMGRNIVRLQSIDEPGKREFLVDSKDICDVLNDGTGTQKILGISALDSNYIDELHVHECAFKGMRNLRFLEISNFLSEGCILHLPESFDYLPPKLKLLSWPDYPMSSMPSSFRPENIVKLEMQRSKLHKLWKGVVSLTCLKEIDLDGSVDLQEIPDLSMATNLEILNFDDCKSLVELPYSIRNLNKLLKLNMRSCKSLEILPSGFNLKSLDHLDFNGCSKLRTFPKFSTNISFLNLSKTNIEEFPSNLHLKNLVELQISKEESDGKQWDGVKPFMPFTAMLSPTLTELWLENIPSLVELPSSFQNLNQLKFLVIKNCINVKTLSFMEMLSPTLTNLYLDNIPILVEFPSSFQKLNQLKSLLIANCGNLETLLFLAMLSPTLMKLTLRNIPSLVELPSSFQNLIQLKDLCIGNCINLETLPTGINFQSLNYLSFSGCSQLRSFPEISTNISELHLNETGIEEVPWWVEKFSNLTKLSMKNCSRLKCVSLHISKLKHLKEVSFSNCGALTRVEIEADNIVNTISERASSSLPELNYMGCYNLKNKDALMQQQSFIFKYMVFSGDEVPSYFTHCTNGSSTTLPNIPLLPTHFFQRFFRFRVCAVVTAFDEHMMTLPIQVNIQFTGRFGNISDSSGNLHEFWGTWNGTNLVIFDCRIPLNEYARENYDYVDMDIHITTWKPSFELKGWGIRLLGECSSARNRLGNPNMTLPHVSEAEEGNLGYTSLQELVSEIEHIEESGDKSVETEIRSTKQKRKTTWGINLFKNLLRRRK